MTELHEPRWEQPQKVLTPPHPQKERPTASEQNFSTPDGSVCGKRGGAEQAPRMSLSARARQHGGTAPVGGAGGHGETLHLAPGTCWLCELGRLNDLSLLTSATRGVSTGKSPSHPRRRGHWQFHFQPPPPCIRLPAPTHTCRASSRTQWNHLHASFPAHCCPRTRTYDHTLSQGQLPPEDPRPFQKLCPKEQDS